MWGHQMECTIACETKIFYFALIHTLFQYKMISFFLMNMHRFICKNFACSHERLFSMDVATLRKFRSTQDIHACF